MLKQMREGSKSLTLKLALFGTLLMAMVGLAFMDINGMMKGSLVNGSLVTYKGGKISVNEFRRSLMEVLRSQNISEADAYRMGIPQQILQSDMDRILVTKAADDVGLIIGDKAAALQVKEIIAPLVEQGATEKEALQQVLMNSGMGEAKFLSVIKNHMATQKLMSVLVANVAPSSKLVEEMARYEAEKRKGVYFTLTTQDIEKVKPPVEDKLEEFYKSIAHEYATTEYRDLSVLVLTKGLVEGGAEISDEKVKQAYEDNIENYTKPETRTISQLVVKDEALAKEAYAAVKDSRDLQAAAAKFSAQFVKAQDYAKNSMAEELAKAAFTSGEGTVTEPVKTALGWHILFVEKISAAKEISFEQVKGEIKKELAQENSMEALYELANQIDDAVAGGASFAEITKQNNLKPKNISGISAKGQDSTGKKVTSDIPVFDKVLEVAFSLDEGSTSNLIEGPDSSFILVNVSKVNPSRELPFKDVRDDVLKKWIAREELIKLSEKSSEILKRAQSEEFEKVAASLNKKLSDTGLISRHAKQDDLKQNVVDTLFAIGKVNEVMPATGGNAALYIIKLADVKIPDFKDVSADDKKKAEAMLIRESRDDFMVQYRAELYGKYKVKVNQKLMEKLYKEALSSQNN